jgi:aerobic-type carbon monoxide dehydrogenase small subunit (CoxS/CutS family)
MWHLESLAPNVTASRKLVSSCNLLIALFSEKKIKTQEGMDTKKGNTRWQEKYLDRLCGLVVRVPG